MNGRHTAMTDVRLLVQVVGVAVALVSLVLMLLPPGHGLLGFLHDVGQNIGPGGLVGGAGAGAAAAGGSKPKRVLPLPGGGWLGTDGRVHYDEDAGVGPFEVSGSVDAGAAPGSDPRGPIVDANYDVDVKVGPVDVGHVEGNVSVSISKPVQDAVSSPYGGQGTQSGAWLKQFMNEP
jgi:hypothetical protein